MKTTISKARMKRMAIRYMDRISGDMRYMEQRLVLQVMGLAIREIGDRRYDSTSYFYTRLFSIHCEGVGIDPVLFREALIKCGLLPEYGKAEAA